MDEQTWLSSADPNSMLRWLTGHGTPRQQPHLLATPRKLRLFAVACCRVVWDGTACPHCSEGFVWEDYWGGVGGKEVRQREVWCPSCRGTGKVGGLTDPRSRAAVEVAERFADGEGSLGDMPPGSGGVVWWLGLQDAAESARRCLIATAEMGVPPATQAALCRCIFGNPFREKKCICGAPVPPSHPGRCEKGAAILSWQGGTVVKLARKAYEERDWSGLGVLADALEESGCTDEDILHHLRGEQRCGKCLGFGWCRVSTTNDVAYGPFVNDDCYTCSGSGWVKAGPHCRGDWCLDLLLGKE